jgi:hypothetical protein
MSHLTRGLFDPRKYSQVWPEPNDDPNIPYAWGLNGYQAQRSIGNLEDFQKLNLSFLKDVLAAKSAILSSILNGELVSEEDMALLTKLNNIDFTSIARLVSDKPMEESDLKPEALFNELNAEQKLRLAALANPIVVEPIEDSNRSIKVGHLIAGACLGGLISALIISNRKGK